MQNHRFKKGERIIWDSHFGYDVGYYLKDQGVMYNTCLIDLMTGVAPGELSVPPYEVHPYSDALVRDMTKKYGYEKAFAKDF